MSSRRMSYLGSVEIPLLLVIRCQTQDQGLMSWDLLVVWFLFFVVVVLVWILGLVLEFLFWFIFLFVNNRIDVEFLLYCSLSKREMFYISVRLCFRQFLHVCRGNVK